MTDAPHILLPYQQAAIRLSHEHPLFVSEKSRRTGMSYAFAADSVLNAAPAQGASDEFYIGYNFEMAREYIGYCADFARAFGRAASEPAEFLWTEDGKNEIKAFRIDFPSGKSIVALSSKPRSMRGMQGNVKIDEAAFHDDFDALLDAAMALTMWGGRIVVISTHNGTDNPFNQLIEDIRAGKREGFVHRLTLADALAEGLFKRICLRAGKSWSITAERAWEASLRKRYGDAAAEELDVIPSRGSGIYFARATVAAAMSPALPVLRLRLPDGFELRTQSARTDYVREWFEDNVKPVLASFDPRRRSYMGGDCGRRSDLSVFAFGQEDELLTLQVRLTIELRNCPFREQEWLLRAVLSRLPLFGAAKMDARGLGWNLAENIQTDFGFDRVEAVQSSQNTYLDGMPKLKSRVEDRRIVLPLDEGKRDDYTVVKLVRGVPMVVDRTDSKADGEKGKRHGDSVIADMFLCMAADADVQDIDFATTGVPRAALLGADIDAASPYGITDHGFGSVGGRHDFRDFR